MASIAIPPVAEWNIKADRNISCWLCQHFQRYDGRGEPSDCGGECRKESPRGADGHQLELESPTDWPMDGYFHVVPNANVAWCNGFQASLEAGIPASPGAAYDDCSATDPTQWTRPDDIRSPAMFIKKAVEDSCWYCDHFQRRFEDSSGQSADSACGGYCGHKPQDPYQLQDGFLPPGPPTQMHTRTFNLLPRIGFAPMTWCSRWERATQAVPDVPESNGVDCQTPV